MKDTTGTLILAACTAILGLSLGMALGIYAGQSTCAHPAPVSKPTTKVIT